MPATKITIGEGGDDQHTVLVEQDVAELIFKVFFPSRSTHIAPPAHVADFDGLCSVIAQTSRLISALEDFRELAIAKADITTGHTDRKKLGLAAGMAPSRLYRVLERQGIPRDRRSHAMAIAVAFRTVDDGKLHLATEDEVEGLASFQLHFSPVAGLTSTEFGGSTLQVYVRDGLPFGSVDFGRARGYSIRDTDGARTYPLTEQMMEALFGDQIVRPGSSAP